MVFFFFLLLFMVGGEVNLDFNILKKSKLIYQASFNNL